MIALRNVEIRFDKEAFEEYKDLQEKASKNKFSVDAKIFNAIEKVLDDLQNSLRDGKVVRIGRAIPVSKLSSKLTKHLKKDGINIIWSVELPEGWRMVYVVTGDEIKIIAIVLHLSDHKNYERFLNK